MPHKSPDQRRLWRLKHSAMLRAKARAFVKSYLFNHPCVDCGEIDVRVLEFDHVDPATKVHAISYMVSKGMKPEKIADEIEKCEVRCCNCHRRRTRRQFWE